jgi:hypothetical protein
MTSGDTHMEGAPPVTSTSRVRRHSLVLPGRLVMYGPLDGPTPTSMPACPPPDGLLSFLNNID